MNTTIAKLALTAAAAFGALAVDGSVNAAQAATTSVIHPAVCKPILDNRTGFAPLALAAWEIGTKTHSSTVPIQIICPLVRINGAGGATVHVEGSAGVPGHTLAGVSLNAVACTAYSLSYRGQLLASKSFSRERRFAGLFDHALSFSATEAPSWASLSVICDLPPQGRGTIHGLSVTSF